VTVCAKNLILPMFLFAAGRAMAANVIHVPADQPTIQAAISAAAHGDSVLVAPGIYVENINFLGKAIRVESEQGAQLTVIDGNQADSVVTSVEGSRLSCSTPSPRLRRHRNTWRSACPRTAHSESGFPPANTP
jgi:hypothetical protein